MTSVNERRGNITTTPVGATVKTPRLQSVLRRVAGSTVKRVVTARSIRTVRRRSRTHEEREPVHLYEGLLKKTWKVFSLSPLYKFRTNLAAFKVYARSLDAAFSQTGSAKCSFEVYHGLSQNPEQEAVRIQIHERNMQDTGSTLVLTAVLLCSEQPPEDSTLAEHFTFFPVVLVAGNKTRADVFLRWMERHFDCRSSLTSFSDDDLQWLFTFGCTQIESQKNTPVLLQYSTASVCSGISTLDCKFEANFCHQLWDRLFGEDMERGEIQEEEMHTFMSALEGHLETTMAIAFKRLTLSEIGTPMAYIAKDGKLKFQSSEGVPGTVQLITSMATEKCPFDGFVLGETLT